MKNFVKSYYERWHEIVDATYGKEDFLSDRDEIVISLLGRQNRILEVGCGAGRVIGLTNANEKYGIDISKTAIASALKLGINAQVVDVDEENLPFESGYFDGVLAVEILEHVFDPVYVLAEINRVLKEDGVLIVTVPNVGYFKIRLALLFGRFTDFHGSGLVVDEHIRFYTQTSLEKLVKLSGFEIEKVIGTKKGLASRSFRNKVGLKLHDDIIEDNLRRLRNKLINIRPSLFGRGLIIKAVRKPMFLRNAPLDFRKKTLKEKEIHI